MFMGSLAGSAAGKPPPSFDFDGARPAPGVGRERRGRDAAPTGAAIALDRELTALAAADSRCRLVQARLAARLVQTRAWRALGFVRLSDFCRERLGLSPRALEEDAWVVGALGSLPNLSAALEGGELTWTRARTLLRVATAANEGALLEASHAVPLRELDAFVRSFARSAEGAGERVGGATSETVGRPGDGNDASETADPTVRWSIAVSRNGRRMWRLAGEYASRSAGAVLSQGQVLEIVAAEAQTAAPPVGDGNRDDLVPRAGVRERALRRRLRSRQRRDEQLLFAYLARTGVAEGFAWLAPRSLDPGPARHLDALLRGLETADPFELESRLRTLRALARRLDAQIATLLRTGIDGRLFTEIGFASAKLYVTSRLGFCSSRAWTLVAIERHARRHSRLLWSAWQQGRITSLQAKTLLPIVDEANADAWIARAQEVTLRRLVDEVCWALDRGAEADASHRRPAPPEAGDDVRPEGSGTVAAERVQMRAHGDVADAASGPAEAVRLRFSVPLSVALLVETTLDRLARRGEARWKTFERMTALALLEWMSAPRHRDPIFERDGWRCAVPACSSRRNLHDHHVLFRSHGGSNGRDNRITVCAAHHLHGIHAGTVRCRGRAPDDVWWELGCAPGRRPLLRLHGDRFATLASRGRAG